MGPMPGKDYTPWTIRYSVLSKNEEHILSDEFDANSDEERREHFNKFEKYWRAGLVVNTWENTDE